MALLHIYDSSDWRIRQTAGQRGTPKQIAAAGFQDLLSGLDALVLAGLNFDRILIETHGCSGEIFFGKDGVDSGTLRSMLGHHYGSIAMANARIYFNGCNVAEGPEGWRFLDAAAALFLTPGGGEVFGQTSLGFGNPISGHVIHLWGDTRRIYVDASGRVLERFEQ